MYIMYIHTYVHTHPQHKCIFKGEHTSIHHSGQETKQLQDPRKSPIMLPPSLNQSKPPHNTHVHTHTPYTE